jgi:uncharacterized membrane protein YeaQ/YmgE (transglycosylase-associated protein family)
MTLLAWMLLGIVAGCLASKLVNGSADGLARDLVLGILGAVAGGWLVSRFGMTGVTGLSVYSLVVAIAGAGLLLIGYHALGRS